MSAPANFDRLARAYRWMEAASFGPFLMRARCAFLAETASAQHALVLGDGDGRFTARLLAANPSVLIDAIDASPAMLAALLRNAGPHAARVTIHCTDIRTWQPAARYDLIVTHFFLDCLSTAEVAALAARLRACAAPGALWLVSDFAIPANLFGRAIAHPLVAALYRAFGLLTGLRTRRLPDHPAALASAGFTCTIRRTLLACLLFAECWSAAAPPQHTAATLR